MFAHVSLAVVLAYELGAAVIARVRFDRFVGVHVGYVVRFADKGAFALITLEGFIRPSCVYPFVQLEIPLGGEVFVAD